MSPGGVRDAGWAWLALEDCWNGVDYANVTWARAPILLRPRNHFTAPPNKLSSNILTYLTGLRARSYAVHEASMMSDK